MSSITGDIAKQKFLDGAAAYTVTGPWNVAAYRAAGMKVPVLLVPGRLGSLCPFLLASIVLPELSLPNPAAAPRLNYLATPAAQEDAEARWPRLRDARGCRCFRQTSRISPRLLRVARFAPAIPAERAV